MHPVGSVPAAYQLFTPLLADCLRHPLPDRFRQGTKGIPVKVEHAIRQVEPVAVTAQWIGEVRLLGVDLGYGAVHLFPLFRSGSRVESRYAAGLGELQKSLLRKAHMIHHQGFRLYLVAIERRLHECGMCIDPQRLP